MDELEPMDSMNIESATSDDGGDALDAEPGQEVDAVDSPPPVMPEEPPMMSHTFEKLATLEKIKHTLKSVDGDFKVPGVVVCGAQSSGKSSVLEHATGLAFPRSEGMCTRVATIVTVCKSDATPPVASVTVASNADYDQDASNFDPEDTNAFAAAITKLTNKLAGDGAISNDPIYVKYVRKEGPTFTLTDLPGITCISRSQIDVEARTIDLTTRHLENENALILCVLPATEDFHNSKALKIAESLDPLGERTIGVVTKVDNLPPGSDLVSRMAGEGEGAIRLKHGFFAVRNRTQAEVDDGISLEAVVQRERQLFRTDAVLKNLPAEQCGMPALLAKVCEEQGRAVDEYIPTLRKLATDRLREHERTLAALPSDLTTVENRRAFLSRTLADVAYDVRRAAEADTSICGTDQKDTNLAARVHEALKKELATRIFDKMPDFLSTETKESLKAATREGRGYDLSNFMQGGAFRTHFANGVAPLLPAAATAAVAAVAECVKTCIAHVIRLHINEVRGVSPVLAKSILFEVEEDIDARVEEASYIVRRMAKAELGATYTNNHYFAQTIAKFREIVVHNSGNWKKGIHNGIKDGESSGIPEDFMRDTANVFNTESNDDASLREMQITLSAYAKVVRKRFSDSAAIVIRDILVVDMVASLPAHLNARCERLLESFAEDKDAAKKRKVAERNIAGLKTVLQELAAL